MTAAWDRDQCIVCGGNLKNTAPTDGGGYPGLELLLALNPRTDSTQVAVRLLTDPARWKGTADTADAISRTSHLRYTICGKGHIFFSGFYLGIPSTGAPPPTTPVYRSHVVAMVGSMAAGKSYLLARLLKQEVPVRPRILIGRRNSIEGVVFASLQNAYEKFALHGIPIPPTGNDSEPGTLFSEHLAADRIWDSIVDLLTEWDDKLSDDAILNYWNQSIFQPVAVQFTVAHAQTFARESRPDDHILLAVTDLSGEKFKEGDSHRDNLRAYALRDLLSGFDAILWTIDPTVSYSFQTWANMAAEDLESSRRPEGMNLNLAIHQRIDAQSHIANEVGGDGFNNRRGEGVQDLIVTIVKADLFHKILVDKQPSNSSLGALGYHGAVWHGIHLYLKSLFSQTDQQRLGYLLGLPNSYVGGELIANRIRLLTDQLLIEFSKPEVFWSLTDTGSGLKIDVPATDQHNPGWQLSIPTQVEDLQQQILDTDIATCRGALISALGAGIACGLGFEATVEALLFHQPERRTSFAVVSTFGVVPVIEEGKNGEILIKGPHDSRSPTRPMGMPAAREPSSGLQNLFMSILRKSL